MIFQTYKFNKISKLGLIKRDCSCVSFLYLAVAAGNSEKFPPIQKKSKQTHIKNMGFPTSVVPSNDRSKAVIKHVIDIIAICWKNQ